MWVEIYSMRNNNSYRSNTVVNKNIIGAPKMQNNFWCTICALLLFLLLFTLTPCQLCDSRQQNLLLLISFLYSFYRFGALIYGLFSVLFPVQLSLFQLLQLRIVVTLSRQRNVFRERKSDTYRDCNSWKSNNYGLSNQEKKHRKLRSITL